MSGVTGALIRIVGSGLLTIQNIIRLYVLNQDRLNLSLGPFLRCFVIPNADK
jgi:hypothetical protein